jgi:hypothetical protein
MKTLEQIHDLKIQHLQQQAEAVRSQKRYEVRERLISQGIYVIMERHRLNMLALMLRGF